MHQPVKTYASIPVLGVLLIADNLIGPDQLPDVPQVKTPPAIRKGLQIALRKGKIGREKVSHGYPLTRIDIEKAGMHVDYYWILCSSLW